MLENKVKDLTDQLLLSSQNSLLFVSRIIKSANYLDSKKFNENKTMLEVFLVQLNFKVKSNLDYFLKKCQDTEQNKLSYAICYFERDL